MTTDYIGPYFNGLNMKTKGIVYYSQLNKDPALYKYCQGILRKSAEGIEIVSVTSIPTDFGDRNIVFDSGHKNFLDMFERILVGLKALDTDVVFMAEDDNVYPKEHFEITPEKDDVYYYNTNCWQIRASDGYAVKYDCKRLSGMCANREFLIRHYEKRIAMCKAPDFRGFRHQGFEPGTHNRAERVDDFKAEGWLSSVPYLDLVLQNATARNWRPEDFRSQQSCRNWTVAENGEIPHWGRFKDFFGKVG